MGIKFLRLTEKGKQTSQVDERLQKLIEGFDDGGVLEYFDLRELKDNYGITPKDLLDLKREGLVMGVEPSLEPLTLEDYAYGLDVAWSLQEATDELTPYFLTHKVPPADLYRRYRRLSREYNRLTGAGGMFV